jgi:serine/threonine protein phosphatase PrpC
MTVESTLMRFDSACATHVGGRESNEDAACVASGDGAYAISVVADGVGGEPWGEIASRTACDSALEIVTSAICRAQVQSMDLDVVRVVRLAFAIASRRIRQRAARERRIGGMRTTLLICVTIGSTLTYGYVGDGGIWLYEPAIERITSLMDPMRSQDDGLLLSALGPWSSVAPVVAHRVVESPAVVISATDGLADLIDDSHWSAVGCKLADGDSPGSTLQGLLAHCASMKVGRHSVFTDNLTIAVIRAIT